MSWKIRQKISPISFILMSSLFFLLLGMYFYGSMTITDKDMLSYAYHFFEEIYIIVLITIFGFVLLSASKLMNVAATTHLHREMIEDIDQEEEWFEHLTSLFTGRNRSDFCLLLFALFVLSMGSWLFLLISINTENISHFYIYSSICMILIISIIGLAILQIAYGAEILESDADSNRGRVQRTTAF